MVSDISHGAVEVLRESVELKRAENFEQIMGVVVLPSMTCKYCSRHSGCEMIIGAMLLIT